MTKFHYGILAVLFVTLGSALYDLYDLQRRFERLQFDVLSCRQEVDGMITPCHCDTHDCSIAASCTREEEVHYEVLWNAELMSRHEQ